ncbi:MAG TPA: pseudouridine synthase [Atribacterota bacterium]|nr:pseudouridine synthase [Atribacterota bacterium]
MRKTKLHKYLANMGIDSRRKCEKLIVQGRVKINGMVVTKLGIEIDPEKDKIEVDNKNIKKDIPRIYIILNKPRGFLCTYNDPFGRPTIYNLLGNIETKLNYAGRLDFDSEGLIFLTNDGELIHEITHPRKMIKKTYRVKVKGFPDDSDIKLLKEGVPLSADFTTSSCQVKILKKDNYDSILEISISEGKKRQIRRVFSYLGFQVLELKRTEIGILNLDGLNTGQYRFLTEQEIDELKQCFQNKGKDNNNY